MGSGYKNFTAGAVLTASDVNNYLMEQGVMYFATTAARDAALSASLEDGMTVYQGTNDANEGIWCYHGSAWRRPWNMSWGCIANTSSGSNTITGGRVAGLDTTFTAVANRLYQFTVTVKTSYSVANTRTYITLTDGGANVQRLADVLSTAAADQPSLNGSVTRTLTAGAHNIAVAFVQVAGTSTLGASAGVTHELTITDIGPAGAPA